MAARKTSAAIITAVGGNPVGPNPSDEREDHDRQPAGTEDQPELGPLFPPALSTAMVAAIGKIWSPTVEIAWASHSRRKSRTPNTLGAQRVRRPSRAPGQDATGRGGRPSPAWPTYEGPRPVCPDRGPLSVLDGQATLGDEDRLGSSAVTFGSLVDHDRGPTGRGLRIWPTPGRHRQVSFFLAAYRMVVAHRLELLQVFVIAGFGSCSLNQVLAVHSVSGSARNACRRPPARHPDSGRVGAQHIDVPSVPVHAGPTP